jgi:hypothetical protein
MSQIKKNLNVLSGFLMLLGLHIVAAILILIIAYIIGNSRDRSGYNLSLSIIIYGIYGFFLWQLIYVIPLCLWLRNKGKIPAMRGVIIGAIITFLVYIGCFLFVIYFITH